jgi:hypothetical protein
MGVKSWPSTNTKATTRATLRLVSEPDCVVAALSSFRGRGTRPELATYTLGMATYSTGDGDGDVGLVFSTAKSSWRFFSCDSRGRREDSW